MRTEDKQPIFYTVMGAAGDSSNLIGENTSLLHNLFVCEQTGKDVLA
jgi:hypothetical protein